MPNPLIVIGEDPVVLDGSIDGSSNLQMKHGSDSLADHDQTLHAKHVDLRQTNETIFIKLVDFTHGGSTWVINASHESGVNTVNWARDNDHAYHDFGAMTDALEVEVTATSNASPPQVKTRRFWMKTMPTDGQPDGP
jgi:hypothetical protein